MKRKQISKRGLDPNYEVEMINRVKDYISMEYGDEIHTKISTLKFVDTLTGYITNCLSLKRPEKYTVPFMAHEIVRFASKTT